jgi:hypothetical protein
MVSETVGFAEDVFVAVKLMVTEAVDTSFITVEVKPE